MGRMLLEPRPGRLRTNRAPERHQDERVTELADEHNPVHRLPTRWSQCSRMRRGAGLASAVDCEHKRHARSGTMTIEVEAAQNYERAAMLASRSRRSMARWCRYWSCFTARPNSCRVAIAGNDTRI